MNKMNALHVEANKEASAYRSGRGHTSVFRGYPLDHKRQPTVSAYSRRQLRTRMWLTDA